MRLSRLFVWGSIATTFNPQAFMRISSGPRTAHQLFSLCLIFSACNEGDPNTGPAGDGTSNVSFAPDAIDDSATTPEDTAVVIDILGNDVPHTAASARPSEAPVTLDAGERALAQTVGQVDQAPCSALAKASWARSLVETPAASPS